MWWADAARLVGLTALVLALAACQVRPLYAPGPTGASVAGILPAVDVALPQTRPEQLFRNALSFRLQGGEGAAAPRYRLDYGLTLVERAVAIEQFVGTPAAYHVEGNLSFVLREAGGRRVLMRERVSAVASYDRSTQEFANIRARQDAEQRVAETLAEMVAIRLAAGLAAL